MGTGWRVHRIAGWSYDLGIELTSGFEEERARIQNYLDEGRDDVVGNLSRQFIERRFKRLCRELRVAVPYREGYENERRTGYELFRALRRHVNASGRFTAVDHAVWNQFDASNFLANLASHDQPEMATSLSAGDIRFALDKLSVLEELFRCAECGKWVWKLRADPNSDQSQCECGQLRI